MPQADDDHRMAVLLVSLDEAVTLLRRCGEAHWSSWMERSYNELVQQSPRALEHLLGAFGGMGSFNDLLVLTANGHDIAPDDEYAVNARLRRLRELIYTNAAGLHSGRSH